MFTKFEYLKFSGCLEDIRVFESFSDNVQVIMKIDDILIPNFRMPSRSSPRTVEPNSEGDTKP